MTVSEKGAVDALFAKAKRDYDAGQFAQANVLLQQLLEQQPTHADAYYYLGNIAENLADAELAMTFFSEAVRLDPKHQDAQFKLAMVHRQQGNYRDAISLYRSLLKRLPASLQICNNLGIVLRLDSQYKQAISIFKRAIKIAPEDASSWLNLGNVYLDQGQLDEAKHCFQQAVNLNTTSATAAANLANVLVSLQQVEAALPLFEKALALEPENPDIHVNYGLSLLLLAGDQNSWQEGWLEHEWRHRKSIPPFCQRFPDIPVLQISQLHNKPRVLVWAEQGIGDECMYATCLPDLVAFCGVENCIVECDHRLLTLFQRSFPGLHVIERSQDYSCLPFQPDAQIACGSLPGLFRQRHEDFPSASFRFTPDPERLEKWRQRFAELDGSLRVGIAWRGGVNAVDSEKRNTRLQQWRSLLALPGVSFVNLQYSETSDEIKNLHRKYPEVHLHTWEDFDVTQDIEDVFAVIDCLDLVIQIDNSSAHFAGCSATPVWNLIPFNPQWRWQLKTDTTPWYSGMRLYRQDATQHWQPVLQKIHTDLSKLIHQKVD